jgi:hypothetical protein
MNSTKLPATAEAKIIETFVAASVEISNRCPAVVAVTRNINELDISRNKQFACNEVKPNQPVCPFVAPTCS